MISARHSDSLTAAITLAALLAWGGSNLRAQSGQIGGPGAAPAPDDTCGTPPLLAEGQKPDQPMFPPGRYPISLPPFSPGGVRNDLPNLYRDGVDFGQLPAGRKYGSSASVTTAPDGTIWVIDRCGTGAIGGSACDGTGANVNPIFQFETSGKLLKNIGAGLFVAPHKLTVDAEGNLWIADNGGNQVFKLNPEGKVLMTLGKRGPGGSGSDQFDGPTEVAVAANGDFFVSDGHDGGGTVNHNARILKFDRNGRFLKTWGMKGMAPGDFDVPHSIALDSRNRLFVADRQNNRIQIFDADGKFIAQWLQFGRPSGIYIDKRTDTMYVSDSESRDGKTNTGRNALGPAGYGYNLGVRRGIRIGSARDGSVTGFIPDPCPYPYAFFSTMGEGLGADLEGNVYDAEISKRIRKFVKK